MTTMATIQIQRRRFGEEAVRSGIFRKKNYLCGGAESAFLVGNLPRVDACVQMPIL